MEFSRIDYDDPLNPLAVYIQSENDEIREIEIPMLLVHNVLEDRKHSKEHPPSLKPHRTRKRPKTKSIPLLEFMLIALPSHQTPSREQRLKRACDRKTAAARHRWYERTGDPGGKKIDDKIFNLTNIFNADTQSRITRLGPKNVSLQVPLNPDASHELDITRKILTVLDPEMLLYGVNLENIPTELLQQAEDCYFRNDKSFPGLDKLEELAFGVK